MCMYIYIYMYVYESYLDKYINAVTWPPNKKFWLRPDSVIASKAVNTVSSGAVVFCQQVGFYQIIFECIAHEMYQLNRVKALPAIFFLKCHVTLLCVFSYSSLSNFKYDKHMTDHI